MSGIPRQSHLSLDCAEQKRELIKKGWKGRENCRIYKEKNNLIGTSQEGSQYLLSAYSPPPQVDGKNFVKSHKNKRKKEE